MSPAFTALAGAILRGACLLTGSLLLAGCGGGGGGGSGTRIDISPDEIELTVVQGGSQPNAVVNVEFTGDGVLAGYAPGVEVPAWLNVDVVSSTASTATFILIGTDTGTVGTRTTTVRFVTGREDGSGVRYADLPVTFRVTAPVTPFDATAQAISFTGIRGDPAGPAPAGGRMISISGSNARWRISAAPPWLDFSATSGTGPASVTVTADVTGLALSQQSGQVTVTDDDSGETRTFNASLTLRAARLVVSPASLQFSLDGASLPAALSRNLAVTDELGGTLPAEAVSWTVHAVSTDWLETSADAGTSSPAAPLSVSLSPAEVGALATGNHPASITLRWQNAELSNQSVVVPVSLANNLPRVSRVSPYVGVEGLPGTFIARGSALTGAGSPVTVQVGGTDITGVIPAGPTLFQAGYPALPAGRYPVSLANAAGIPVTGPELVIVTAPTFGFDTIEALGARHRIFYDAERATLVGVRPAGNKIERFRHESGSWTPLPPHEVAQVTDAVLALDGRSMVVLTRASIRQADLTVATFDPVVRQSLSGGGGCGESLQSLAMLHSGRAVIARALLACSGFTLSLIYDIDTNSLAESPYPAGLLYNGVVAGSADGSVAFAGSLGVSPAQPVQIYDAYSGSVTNGAANYNLARISASSDGSRVLLAGSNPAADTFVHDRQLTLDGTLPGGGIAVVSPDGGRAFVYREVGADAFLVVYDLEGALLPGAVFPELDTIPLVPAPNAAAGSYQDIALAVTPDGSTVFVSGNTRILVVPVE